VRRALIDAAHAARRALRDAHAALRRGDATAGYRIASADDAVTDAMARLTSRERGVLYTERRDVRRTVRVTTVVQLRRASGE
jgi:hypothetical protein